MVKYIANQKIDKYEKGDEVPDELGSLWFGMYKFPPVDKISDTEVVEDSSFEPVPEKVETPKSPKRKR